MSGEPNDELMEYIRKSPVELTVHPFDRELIQSLTQRSRESNDNRWIWIPNENIYKGVKINGKVYNPLGNGSDWALIKLDRKVEGHPVVKLSENAIYLNLNLCSQTCCKRNLKNVERN